MRALPCSSHDSGLRGIPVRVVHVYDGDGLVVWGEVPGAHSGSWEEWRWREEGRLPDLTDPATLGCLLALVREARGRLCYTQPCGGYWTVQREDTDEGWGDHCVTEAEALVVALECAP